MTVRNKQCEYILHTKSDSKCTEMWAFEFNFLHTKFFYLVLVAARLCWIRLRAVRNLWLAHLHFQRKVKTKVCKKGGCWLASINFSFINDEEKKVNITITVLELQAKHTRNGRCILAVKLDWTDCHTHSLILGFLEGPPFGGFLTNSSEIRLLLILTYSF